MEDRSRHFTGRRMKSGLLDYQQGALHFLKQALLPEGSKALLALDTGLGKSAVVKELVDYQWLEKGFRSIVIVPSTLVDQTVRTLVFPPWEKPPAWFLQSKNSKAKQELLKGFGVATLRSISDQKALLATPIGERPHVLVCNAACREAEAGNFSGLLLDRHLVVVEEAYSPSYHTCHLHAHAPESSRILFVTATPDRLLSREPELRGQNHFRVKKTPQLLLSLGMADPKLELLKLQETQASFFSTGRLGDGFLRPLAMHALDEQCLQPFLEQQPPTYLKSWQQFFDSLPEETCRSLAVDYGGPVVRPGKPYDSQFLLWSFRAMVAASPGSLTSYLRAMAKAAHQQHGRDTCRCCALTEYQLSEMAGAERKSSLLESVEFVTKTLRQELAPEVHGRGGYDLGRFGATIVRCSCLETINQVVQDLSSDSSFEIHKLTTGLSSRQRTKVLQSYTCFKGDRAAMCVLRRGSDQLQAQGSPLGRKPILALVSKFVTRHHVLLADASIEVGIESLHRCTDSVILQQLPTAYDQLLQLGGRVSRLALDLPKPQPPIVVRCPLRIGTVDELLARHLRGEAQRQKREQDLASLGGRGAKRKCPWGVREATEGEADTELAPKIIKHKGLEPMPSLEEKPLALVGQGAPQWDRCVDDVWVRSFSSVRRGAFSEEDLARWWEVALDQTPWERPRVRGGRQLPRSAAWFVKKECSCCYEYNGTQWPSVEFPDWLLEVEQAVWAVLREGEGAADILEPNSCVANFYADGAQSVDWHADNEPLFEGLLRDCQIVSLSLGETRRFELRRRRDLSNPLKHCDRVVLDLHDGDIVTMEAESISDGDHLSMHCGLA
ncbi:Alkbh3 [Symbiodinium sp. CCMP2456]|nr:Alkbh3 [Symbiodinium sp. CCMP2456]